MRRHIIDGVAIFMFVFHVVWLFFAYCRSLVRTSMELGPAPWEEVFAKGTVAVSAVIGLIAALVYGAWVYDKEHN